jgi:hypothetical protein
MIGLRVVLPRRVAMGCATVTLFNTGQVFIPKYISARYWGFLLPTPNRTIEPGRDRQQMGRGQILALTLRVGLAVPMARDKT